MEVNLAKDILNLIDTKECLQSLVAADLLQQPHQKIVGAIKSLESLGNVVEVQQQVNKSWVCTEEGEQLAAEGSHEAKLYYFISDAGDSVDNIKRSFPAAGVALGAALKNKWIRKDGDKILKCVDSIEDSVKINLQAIKDGANSKVDDKIKLEYRKRKLIKEMDITTFEVKKGSNFSTSVSKQEAELTKDMIESGQWKNKIFKPFNFNAKGKSEVRSGYLHPLMQLRGEFRHIFLEMGFTEMPTNNYIESAFWNFDALFQPQQHPARDAQDTFYIADPEKTLSVPLEYLGKVKEIHSCGGYGSTGYRSPWSFEESQKNLLRTHTTAVSARLLCKLAQDGFKPVKYFSIDKVYRNETLDATHLAEFHQVEGVIADYNLSMKHLMGIFTAFFEKIGIRNIRFKPTYNPYTEPSMEIYSFHDGLKKWVEVGNSGYFRPEMLRPMGLPSNVTVAGWGLSLERPAMIMFGINNIRELVGSKVKMELILDNPVCTIDKFGRNLRGKSSSLTVEEVLLKQEKLLVKLENFKSRAVHLTAKKGLTIEKNNAVKDNQPTANGPQNILLNIHPSKQPYCLFALLFALADCFPMSISVHVHSSVTVEKMPENHHEFWSKIVCNKQKTDAKRMKLTVVWKCDEETNCQPTLFINPLTGLKVSGEPNIARYFCRLLDSNNVSSLYEAVENLPLTGCIDVLLDECHRILYIESSNKNETMNFLHSLNSKLTSSDFLCGRILTIADLVVLSTVRQLNMEKSKLPNLQTWIKRCSKNSLLASVVFNENQTNDQ